LPPPGGMGTPGSGRRGGTPPGAPAGGAPRGPPRPPAGGAPPPPPPGATGAPRPPAAGAPPAPPMEGRHNAPIPDWAALTGSPTGQTETGNSVSSTAMPNTGLHVSEDQSYRLLLAGRGAATTSSRTFVGQGVYENAYSPQNSPRMSESGSSQSSLIDHEECEMDAT
jgi:hypothetical protein